VGSASALNTFDNPATIGKPTLACQRGAVGFRTGLLPGRDEDVGYSRARVRVIVAGGHGQIGLWLQRGRNSDHVDDVRTTGVDAVVCGLEHTALDQVAGIRGDSL
jgi:hypothetical protein